LTVHEAINIYKVNELKLTMKMSRWESTAVLLRCMTQRTKTEGRNVLVRYRQNIIEKGRLCYKILVIIYNWCWNRCNQVDDHAI